MFDIFKKLDEDQNNGEPSAEEPSAEEPSAEEPSENVEEKIAVEENIKEESPSEELNTQEPYQTEEEKILSMLEALGGEEQALLAEKSQLVNMEETLRYRIREEIEIKRHRIENLKHEIPELKQRCEVLAKALNIPIQK
jgi:predicted RNase H-like nuclease (RuvC/YqgF family)